MSEQSGIPKPTGVRPPSKIGRPACTVAPKPALPPSPGSLNTMEPIWESPNHRSNNIRVRRRGSDNSVVLTEDTDSFIIGDRVWVGGTKPGQIAYIGETQFAPGDWAGIVLDEPIGKNDGSVAGCRYFQCEPKRGIFSRLTRITRQPISGSVVYPSSLIDKNSLAKSSLNDSTTSLASTATTTTRELQIGERVIVSSSQGSKIGVLRYIGQTEFAPGEWCGVELDEAVGKNDGSVADKRYFECKPKHGLFAPVHKVSRSPLSMRSTCTAHKPIGASLNVSLLRSRTGSRESLSSVVSTATSFASRASAASTTPSARLQKAGLPHTSTPVRKTAQDLLKDRRKEIETLRKERDLDRERVTKAATQADEAEKANEALKKEFEKFREDVEKVTQDTQNTLTKVLEEKELLNAQLEDERRKCEDLLFRFEEESINKDDVQKDNSEQIVTNTKYENTIKELEKQLSEERERIIQLEKDSTKLFEAEEELTKLRLELQSVNAGEKSNVLELQKHAEELEKTKAELEKLVEEKGKSLEQYVTEISELNRKLEEKEKENVTQEESKSNLQKHLDETTKQLQDKCAFIDELQNNFKTQTENLQKEIQQLRETIQSITEQNKVEKVKLIEEHEKALKEKEEFVKTKSSDLMQESQKLFAAQESVLEQLKAENTRQMQKLSKSFESQVSSRDTQIEEISNQLEEKVQYVKKLSTELEQLRNTYTEKENYIKKLSTDLHELDVKLNESNERNAALNKQINQIICEHETEIKVITDEKSKLEKDVVSLKTEINSLKEQLSKLNECVKTKDHELLNFQSIKSEDIESLKKQFQEELENKNKSIQDITADASKKFLKLSALEIELNDLRSVIANKEEEIRNLSEKTAELRDALSLSEQTKTNLESELHMYEANVAELTEKFSRAEEKISQLTSQKEKLEIEISNIVSTSVDSSEKLVKYSEDLRQKEKELDQARELEFELQKLISTMESKTNTIEQDLSKANSLVEQLKSENKQINLQIATEKQAMQSALEKITCSQAVERDLVNKNYNFEESLKKQTSELIDLKNSFKTVQENNARLEKELTDVLERHKTEKSQLELQINEKGNDQASLRENIEILEKLNVQLLSDKQALDKSIKELNNSLNATNQRIVDLECLVVNKDSQIQELTNSLENLKTEKEEVKKSSAVMNSKYNDAITELTLLKSSNINFESQMTLEITNLKQQLKDEKNTLDTALKESKNSLNELNKELVVSSENNVKLNQRCTEMESIISLKEKEMQGLSDNLNIEKNNNESLKQEIQVLKENITAKHDEIASNANCISSLNEKVKNLESNISNLIGDLANKTELIAQLENKIIELTKLGEAKVSDNIKEKQKELDDLKKKYEQELASKEAVLSELKNAGDSKEKSIQELINKQKDTENLLKKYEQDIHSKDKTINDLKQIEDVAKITLHNYEEKQKAVEDLFKKHEVEIKSKDKMIIDLQSLEKELEERIQNFLSQINHANEKSALLEESQKRLETENKQLLTNYNETVKKLNIANENLKNSTNNDISNHKVANQKTEESANNPIISSSATEFEKLKEEYDLAKGQIDFLNSVIVDMQHKNETMACKIQVLEMGIPPQEADDYNFNVIQKKSQPLRMFCDICDQFDLHETEDCPKQAQDPEPPVPVKSEKKVPVQRPYCENCEIFGHDTLDCEDTETY